MDVLSAKNGCMYIICHLTRPGGVSFAMELEHRYYYPGEAINEIFQIFNVTYDGGTHFVIEIPAGLQAYNQVTEVAAEFNLKIVPGKPFNGHEEFPVRCTADKCFVLETVDHEILGDITSEMKRLREKYSI